MDNNIFSFDFDGVISLGIKEDYKNLYDLDVSNQYKYLTPNYFIINYMKKINGDKNKKVYIVTHRSSKSLSIT